MKLCCTHLSNGCCYFIQPVLIVDHLLRIRAGDITVNKMDKSLCLMRGGNREIWPNKRCEGKYPLEMTLRLKLAWYAVSLSSIVSGT